MNQPEILYAGNFVISMLLIGLLLTIREFSRLQRAAAERRQRSVSGHKHEGTEARIHMASGF
jgi:hypothetical protein